LPFRADCYLYLMSMVAIKKEEDLIRQYRLDSNACIAKRDVDGVSKYWMSDFVQVAGDGSHTIGKAIIAADWKYMFSQSSPVFERLPDEIVVGEAGDLAWEKGKWVYKNDKYWGNYSAMWRKVKGKWLTQCELYVSLNK
jgi:ketosteroid isomerase-like protein